MATIPTCPNPDVARLGKTLKTWRAEFLGYFDTAAPAVAAPKRSPA